MDARGTVGAATSGVSSVAAFVLACERRVADAFYMLQLDVPGLGRAELPLVA
jgi:hypothetical protein